MINRFFCLYNDEGIVLILNKKKLDGSRGIQIAALKIKSIGAQQIKLLIGTPSSHIGGVVRKKWILLA